MNRSIWIDTLNLITKVNRIFLNLCLVVLSLVISLFIAEAFLSLESKNVSSPAQALLHSPQTEAAIRLLIIGDSFIRNGGDLDQSLKKSLGPRGVFIKNTAFSGYGPTEYLEKMQVDGTELKPDIVLLSYYVGNDLTDLRKEKKGNTERFQNIWGGLRIKLLAYYHGTNIYQKYKKAKLKINTDKLLARDCQKWLDAGIDPAYIEKAKAWTINPWAIQQLVDYPEMLLDALLVEKPRFEESWFQVQKKLRQIHQLSAKSNSRMLVVIFPNSLQVSRLYFDFVRRFGGIVNDRTLSENKPQELMIKFCQEEGIEYLDLLPLFRQEAGRQLYLTDDEHLNPAGDEMSAALIIKFLNEKTIIGKRSGSQLN